MAGEAFKGGGGGGGVGLIIDFFCRLIGLQ